MEMKIYLRLTNCMGGANIITSNLEQYFQKKSINYEVNYLPRFLGFLPFSNIFFENREKDFDVVHKDVFTAFFKSKKPTLVNIYHLVHVPYYKKYQTFLQRIYYKFLYWYEKRAIKNADIVVCLSRHAKKQLESIFGYKNSIVLYGGVDIKHFKPMSVKREKFGINRNKKVLLFTGNLLRRKGADLLPKIMEKLDDEYLLLLTSGMRKNRRFIRKNIISLGRVNFKELPQIYNVSDILLFPTRLESFGYSVAEAMACGKPVVTTNCSSLPELIINGRGGFLCKIDDVDDFVEKIRILANDENLRKKMGRFNRKRALRKFTLEKMGQKCVNLYRKLVNLKYNKRNEH